MIANYCYDTLFEMILINDSLCGFALTVTSIRRKSLHEHISTEEKCLVYDANKGQTIITHL